MAHLFTGRAVAALAACLAVAYAVGSLFLNGSVRIHTQIFPEIPREKIFPFIILIIALIEELSKYVALYFSGLRKTSHFFMFGFMFGIVETIAAVISKGHYLNGPAYVLVFLMIRMMPQLMHAVTCVMIGKAILNTDRKVKLLLFTGAVALHYAHNYFIIVYLASRSFGPR